MNHLPVSRRLLAALFGLTWAAATLDLAQACACCADPGQRNVIVTKLDPVLWEEIRRLRFEATAELFQNAAGLDAVRGIAEPASRYRVDVLQDRQSFVFNLADERGRTGSLTLQPRSISIFEVDTHEKLASGGGPWLYKEWRLPSQAGATGIFSAGNGDGHTLTLIFHGRGNSCPNASDFRHWTLVMRGKQAEYSLYGKLRADQ